MKLQKVTFQNKEGHYLKGRLEFPANRHPHNFAVFAHCFTCTKNLSAVRNIGKALTANGFGVLRFDFTGLGESEGDFENTNFSGNVQDLVAAADYLAVNHSTPTLLIGHSLGGAAVISAAGQIDSVKALVTIGAPSNPVHVQKLLKSSIAEIETNGKAVVNLSGRDFTIKKQFLDDLQSQPLTTQLGKMRKSLLILHSPQDSTVAIKNAEEIYLAAHHPKSFISLDGADHLLSNKADSHYVGEVISGWAKRYLNIETPKEEPRTQHQVVASLDDEDGFTTQMKIGDHYLIADEPEDVGGTNFGPSPYELLSAGLSACTAMTLQMYAKRKGWPIANVEVHTSYGRDHLADCEACESEDVKIDTFHREIKLTADLDDNQKKRMVEIADKCPVHKTLMSETQIITKLVE